MAKHRDYLFFAFVAGVFLLMLHSMNAWFLWNVEKRFLELPIFVLGVIYYLKHQSRFYFSSKIKIIFVLFSLAIIWRTKIGFTSILMLPLSLFLLMGMSRQYINKVLRWWTNLYAIILAVSLIGWALSWIGVLPSHGIIIHPAHDNYTYSNYIFCIRGAFYDIRFNSIFLEPGHTAMIAAFTLIANKFDLKNNAVLVILICSIFTFSLAGYVLIVIGYFLIALQSFKFKYIAKKMIPYLVLMIGIYFVGITYNKGNNLFNELILERLEFDEEKGIVGNNRTGDITDETFAEFCSSSDFLYGMSVAKYKSYVDNEYIEGAGYKLFLMSKGIIGLILVICAYYSMCRIYNDRRFAFYVFLIYALAFWQRAYPFWYSWMTIFLFAISNNFSYSRKYVRLYSQK